jgi:hypothetical protein
MTTLRDYQRWARKGSTSARGYDHKHQAERKRRLARWRPGDPCVRCGLPMMGPPVLIDLGHTDDRTGYTGLEHRACNRADGAIRGNRMRKTVTTAWRSSRAW